MMSTGSFERPHITLDSFRSILLKLMFFSVVGYFLMQANEGSFVFIAGLEDTEETLQLIHRYRIVIDCESGKVDPPELLTLSVHDVIEPILDATGYHVTESDRFTDGAVSMPYK